MLSDFHLVFTPLLWLFLHTQPWTFFYTHSHINVCMFFYSSSPPHMFLFPRNKRKKPTKIIVTIKKVSVSFVCPSLVFFHLVVWAVRKCINHYSMRSFAIIFNAIDMNHSVIYFTTLLFYFDMLAQKEWL